MNVKHYLVIPLCLFSLGIHAQLSVDWTKFYEGTDFEPNITDNAWYVGAFPLPTFEGDPLLAYKYFYSPEGSATITSYELIDANTGELTGNSITLDDPSPWTEPELNHLIKTENGYMSFINEGNRLSFVKFDKTQQLLDPSEVGTAIAEFDTSTTLFRYTNMELVPTSFGMVGTTMGYDMVGDERVYSPFIFACDTSFNVRFAKRIENDKYYFGNRFLLATNAQDEIFTVSAKKHHNQFPTTSDTLILSKFDATGENLYTQFLKLADGTVPRMMKLDISADESELLISGLSHGSLQAILVRVKAEDGSLIERITPGANDLIDEPAFGVGYAMAQYDVTGNIILVAEIAHEGQQSSVQAFQLDLNGKVLDQKEILPPSGKRPILWRMYRLEDNLFISGEELNPGSPVKRPFLAKVSTQALDTRVSDDISEQISFTVFPNPIRERLSIRWNNSVPGSYRLTMLNQLGQEMRSLQSQGVWGSSKIDINVAHIPPGSYFVKLQLNNGFAVRHMVKLE